MSTKGRPAKPVQLKKLQGTLHKERIKIDIKFDLITQLPKPEVWIDLKAKKYFKQFCTLLIAKEILTDANVGHVLIMAQEFSTYEKACRELQKEGVEEVIETKSGYKQPNPWLAIRNNAQKNFRDYAALFGLDPVSAQKIGGTVRAEHDDFEKLTNKYGA